MQIGSSLVKSHTVNHLEEANIQKEVLGSTFYSVINLSKITSFSQCGFLICENNSHPIYLYISDEMISINVLCKVQSTIQL